MAERVDFYVLADSTQLARWDVACRLTEKAYKLGNSVLILLASQGDAEAFEAHLWTFKPESFVPHTLLDEIGHTRSQVMLSTCAPENQAFDLLINLADAQLPKLQRYGRLAEIVVQTEAVLHATRQQFTYYKSQNLTIQTHKF